MKGMLLIILVVVAPIFASSQCNVKTVVDEFTGDTITNTEKVKLSHYQSPSWGFSYLVSLNDMNTLWFHIHTVKVCSVEKDEILYIKFVDGEIMRLSNMDFVISERSYQIGLEMANAVLVGAFIEPEEVQKLCDTPIDKVRILSSCGNLIIETKEKTAADFKDCACAYLNATR